MPPDEAGRAFRGVRVLITGGLGFIGSTLAIRLVECGAAVTLIDAMIPEYGGNLFNIEPVRGRVTVNFGDVCDRCAMDWLVRGQDFVFHLAGQVSHVMSLTDPYPDLEYNIKGTVVLMEALRRFNRGARLVFTGTRGQYGPATRLPVAEDAPTNPKGIYEISNLTAEKIIQVYKDVHGVHSVLLRLTNVYGPRAQMKHPHYGVVNWFVRLALDDACIPVFGDGQIKRDFLYIDDCVEALLLCAIEDRANGEVLNVGVDHPTTFLELARTVTAVGRSGRWAFAPFSAERRAQEPGDFYSDIRKIRRLVGWTPRTPLDAGLRQTVDYYRAHRDHYWEPEAPRGGVNFAAFDAQGVPRTKTNEAVMAVILPTRVLFLGNHNVGHDALRLVVESGVNVVGVLAHPDSDDPRDQWHRSVKRLAARAQLPVFQPASLKDEAAARLVRGLAPDLLLSVSYGKIIPRAVLDVPRIGAVNLHGALLPDYRGRFGPVWAVMNGERRSGATLHVIDEGIDTGDVIDQAVFDIAEDDTGYTVYTRMCAYALDLLRRNLAALLAGAFARRPQAHKGRYYSALSDADRCVRWAVTTRTVLRQIRACYFPPYPSSHTLHQGERCPIWRAAAARAEGAQPPGTVVGFDGADRPIVRTGDGAVVLLETELMRPSVSVGTCLGR